MAGRTPKPTTLDAALAQRGALTQLAKRLDITVGYLCDIRYGRKVPSLGLAAEIADATGVPIASLVRRKQEAA
jgi:transcriptional regulator with XRE-family HTH domain